MTEGGVTTTYTYDDWGRTISKADGTHSATYGWRFGDKLRTYASTFPGEADVNFQYDGLGKRRMKLTNPSAPTDADRTWYRWDAGWNVIGEFAAGTDTGTTWDVGALTRWYQGKAAHADGDPDSTAYNYYAHDHLGSPRTTYSQGQAVVARIEFTPYGTPLTTAGQDMDLGFTGHKWDAETGSFYAPYRYYSPASARWASRDPLGMVDGPNVYGYVTNQPTRMIDPLGEKSCEKCETSFNDCMQDASDKYDERVTRANYRAAKCGAGILATCAAGCAVTAVLTVIGYAACMTICVTAGTAGCAMQHQKRIFDATKRRNAKHIKCRDSRDECMEKCCDE
ncbi:MAG: hypothetical protein RLZZ303_192 [Candidatus Hydrogenedentota bacterium]|jgi:RHS repeat-associated protein